MPKQSNSLAEVHSTVSIPKTGKGWRRMFAFFGPAYLVSVGYMDPGNWATDIAAGSKFGYQLIWVLLMSNIMAIFLQSLCTRLGIVYGRDLAQASKDSYSKATNFVLYILAEIAIAACDLAEVLGMAIGLQLLFDLPLMYGVLITLLDTFLLLFLINKGMRLMEAFILALIAVISVAFLVEMFIAKPVVGEIMSGFIPSLANDDALYIAIGIIGATVMPHNLYLHSSLVQSRNFERTPTGKKEAIRFNFLDSVIALNMAFFVNAAIMILAAATFFHIGMHEVSEIQDAHRFLEPLLGTAVAPILFAVALIAAGQSSTLTGTLAGQIVMEGYLNLRIQPWIRRLITRVIAIIPAVITIYIFGESATGGLLILSQVILSLQLGFAIVPLIHFVSDKNIMGDFAIGPFRKIFAWLIASIIIILNIKLVYNFLEEWVHDPELRDWMIFLVIPLAVAAAILLLIITFRPFIKRFIISHGGHIHKAPELTLALNKADFRRVALALDFSDVDRDMIQYSLALAHPETKFLLIHTVETATAMLMGKDANDYETSADSEQLEKYRRFFQQQGFDPEVQLVFGLPTKEIPKAVNKFDADLLILGSHGHKQFKDLIFGTTIDKVRHRVNMSVFIVNK
ncbi:MAG TPA: Nramp family divalent metal transporter [Saprospiraceae bacterium]|nr:Nramp family divalent metal transporter [Saprospiraceae bacterium]HQW55912.1 Nramp family divalent metal transporter [Saprospiraceae bacterium]